MKFKMYHVIFIVLLLVVVGGIVYVRCLNELEKPVVHYESEEDTKEENIQNKEEVKNENIIDNQNENVGIEGSFIEEDAITDEMRVADLKGETVKNNETLKPAYVLKETFMNYEEVEGYISENYMNEDPATLFYLSQFSIGDDVWHGLYSEYKASSTYQSTDDKYNVQNLNYLKKENCWVEGAKGNGVGEIIEINTFGTSEKIMWGNDGTINENYESLEDTIEYLREKQNGEGKYIYGEQVKVTENTLKNYYHSRVDTIAIINGYAQSEELWKANGRVKKLKLTIDDKIECYLELEDTDQLQLFNINYANETITEKINLKFEILEVYPGEKYDDTCLTSLYAAGGSNVRWGGR